jgi:ATP-dependent RNA helicase DeaD
MQHPFQIAGLEITPELASALAREAITTPTEVQLAAAPLVADPARDVIIQSGTGTGKTLAYLLPLLQRVRADPSFCVLVLAPSPELAMQIVRVVEAYKGPGVSSCGLVGGANLERQKDKLKKHPQVMAGTPGRVFELMFGRKLKAKDIKTLVLDETDEILSPQNEAPLRELLSRPEFSPQLVFASATFGPRAEKLAHDLMRPGFARVAIGASPLPASITHYVTGFEAGRKDVSLLGVLAKAKIGRAIVFVNKLELVGHLYRFLNEHQIPTLTISSERSKHDREKAMKAFKNDEVRLLVATDTAARGLDVTGIDWVIHYDVARDVDTYVHRAGRTGRGGRPGASVMMVAPDERFLLTRYSEKLGITFESLR